MTGRLGDSRRDVLARTARNARLRRVLAAFMLFNLAEWAAWIALLVWAYQRNGVTGAGTIALVQLVPAALLAVPLAALVARLPVRWALATGYAVQATGYALTAVLLWVDASYLAVALAAAVTNTAVTMTRPAHLALLPTLSQTTHDVTAANAASGVAVGIATFLGPALSGLLLALGGAELVLAATALASVSSVLLTVRIVPATRLPDGNSARVPTPPRTPLWRAVRREPAVLPLGSLVAVSSLLLGCLDILLVALALDVLGMNDAGPGLLNSALGIGGLAGGGATVLLVGRTRLAPALLVGAAIAGVGTALAGLATWVGIAFVCIALCGMGRSFLDVTVVTLLQRVVPDRTLNAVLGVQESLVMGGLALGAVIAPPLVVLLGTRAAFVVAGMIVPVLTLTLWSRLRRLDAAAALPGAGFDLLAEIPLFSVLTQRVVERLDRDLTPVEVEPATRIVTVGELGDAFYVIESGQVEVTSSDGALLRTLGPGDWFGELALLRDIPRTATVTALSAVRVLRLERDPFLTAVTGSAGAALVAADEHARRYRDLEGL